jgi:hypothetical protein
VGGSPRGTVVSRTRSRQTDEADGGMTSAHDGRRNKKRCQQVPDDASAPAKWRSTTASIPGSTKTRGFGVHEPR